jgi:hypothetical protein
MRIEVFGDLSGQRVAVLDTEARTIETEDEKLRRYADEGIELLGRGSTINGVHADEVVTYTWEHPRFWAAFCDRVRRDGYTVDARTLARFKAD